jgi:hypothetical protein
MVAARISNHATLAFLCRKGRNLVVGATQFECADGLKVLELKKQLAPGRDGVRQVGLKKRRADRNALQSVSGFLNVSKGNDGEVSGS